MSKNVQTLKIGLTCTGTEANVISSCIWWKKHLPPEQLPSHENHVYTMISYLPVEHFKQSHLFYSHFPVEFVEPLPGAIRFPSFWFKC